jgi:hypothetical protein
MEDGDLDTARPVYFGDLDTVRFANDVNDDVRQARAVTVMADLMVGMLADNVAPMLSQPQSFDNQLLLNLLSAESPGEDRLAFFRLAQTGFVRVGLLKRNGGYVPAGRDPYTVISAFGAALANSAFELSGWPELNSNPELRQEVLHHLDDPDARMGSTVPSAVAARVSGLVALDRSLARSPTGITIVEHAASTLGRRVTGMLRTVSTNDESLREAHSALARVAAANLDELNSRSGWYGLIRQLTGIAAATREAVRDIVDVNYNQMVAESLGGKGTSLSVGEDEIAQAAADQFTPGMGPGRQLADLRPGSGRGDWLHWSDVSRLLPDLQVLSRDDRLSELERLQKAFRVDYDMTHSWGITTRISLLGAAGTFVISLGSSLLTGADLEQAAASGGLMGTAILLGASPVARAVKRHQLARIERRVSAGDDRNAIRAGAAAWIDTLQPR